MRQTDEPRGCLATLAVLVAMLGVLGSGVAAAVAVADLPERPIDIGDDVSVRPLPGWVFEWLDEEGVLLSKGSGSLHVQTHPLFGEFNERSVLRGISDDWTADAGLTAGPIETVDIRPGQPEARFAYSGAIAGWGAPVEGEVIGVRGSAVVVVFDAWSGFGEYWTVSGEISEMIEQAVIP